MGMIACKEGAFRIMEFSGKVGNDWRWLVSAGVGRGHSPRTLDKNSSETEVDDEMRDQAGTLTWPDTQSGSSSL